MDNIIVQTPYLAGDRADELLTPYIREEIEEEVVEEKQPNKDVSSFDFMEELL